MGTTKEIIRFVIVGFINTFNYYVLYLLFNEVFQLHYGVAHILAFVISMVGSFYLNSYFTYKTKPTLKKFLRFPLTYIVNITVTTSSIFLLVEVMKLDDNIAPLLASVIAIPFTFIISRKILKKN
jgi:putative flippase GtrA